TRVARDLLGRRANQAAAELQRGTREGRDVRQPGIPRVAARRAREMPLDDPVLERVEADHDETSARRAQRLGLLERGFERVELAIHRDADRLKDAGCGMNLRLAASDRTRDDLGEPGRRRDRLRLAGTNDRGRDRARPRLLAVLADHARELVL